MRRPHDDLLSPHGLALHETVKKLGRSVTCGFGVQRDARQRGVGKLAHHSVVVHSNDGNIVGHPDAQFLTDLKHVLTTIIIACHDADGLREPTNPFAHL